MTRYADHCPCCSLELRKIITAAKDADGDAAAGPSKDSSKGDGQSESRLKKT